MIVGDDAGPQGKSPPRFAALERAVHRQFAAGARGQGLSRMRDHECQPTSTAFLRACGTLGMQQTLTSDNTPKGHAATERVMRMRKDSYLWRQEWTWPFALRTALESGIAADQEQS
jgi:hypothetical protein